MTTLQDGTLTGRVMTTVAAAFALSLGVASLTKAGPAPLVVSSANASTAPTEAEAVDPQDSMIRRAFREVLDRQPTGAELRYYRERVDLDRWTERDIRNDLKARYPPRLSAREAERLIRRAYQDLLFRDPDPAGLRTYRREMLENGWSEQDVRRALRESPEFETERARSAENIIRRVYKDLLRREPDQQGLRRYRREMLSNGWNEQDVRKAVLGSPEYREVREKAADATVRKLYRDLLDREPDPQGLAQYRDRMVKDDWSERDVRNAIMKSPEYVQKHQMTREKALEIVNRAYRSVLGRDADPGAEGWVQRVLREKWSQADVERELRKSDEYKNKSKRR